MHALVILKIISQCAATEWWKVTYYTSVLWLENPEDTEYLIKYVFEGVLFEETCWPSHLNATIRKHLSLFICWRKVCVWAICFTQVKLKMISYSFSTSLLKPLQRHTFFSNNGYWSAVRCRVDNSNNIWYNWSNQRNQ